MKSCTALVFVSAGRRVAALCAECRKAERPAVSSQTNLTLLLSDEKWLFVVLVFYLVFLKKQMDPVKVIEPDN